MKSEKYKKTNTINRKLNTLKQHNKNQEQQKTNINTHFILEPLT